MHLFENVIRAKTIYQGSDCKVVYNREKALINKCSKWSLIEIKETVVYSHNKTHIIFKKDEDALYFDTEKNKIVNKEGFKDEYVGCNTIDILN